MWSVETLWGLTPILCFFVKFNLVITGLTSDICNILLLQMIEGCPPFSAKQENEVPKLYAAKERPPFNSPAKRYAHGLKE